MLKYPGFNPIALEIGPVKVHWYGIMYLLGFAGGWWLARLRAARPGSTWKASDVDDLIFYNMLGVILGGRIGYVLFYGLGFWAKDIWYPFKIWEGGMSFHGGLLGTMAAMALYAWRQRRNLGDVFDFTAPLPALGLFFGRIGNFINGELWGKTTTVPWGFEVNGQVRHPSQLYEAVGEGIIVAAIVWWVDAKSHAEGWYRPGTLTATFLIAYGVVRFGLEFTRQPDAQLGFILGPLSMGQLLCLAMILVGVAVAAWTGRRRGKQFVG